jgi:indolepyruvate ferredoxin oxidoreductase beta subunit
MLEMILCGRGGQGIVFMTRQIGRLATAKGMNVISSETHGMAVRGGSINSHLRIGPFHSPLVRQGHAHMIISLDAAETANNIHFLKPGGLLLENSPLPGEDGIMRLDATRLAKQVGRVQLENVVMLGLVSTLDIFPFSTTEIRDLLAEDPRDSVRTMNLRALEAGSSAA